MKPVLTLALTGLSLVLLFGCKSETPSPSGDSGTPGAVAPPTAPEDPVVATVNGVSINMSELQDPLIDAYGLNMLLKLVLRDLVRQEAAMQNIAITPEDIQAETDKTLLSIRKYANAQLAQTEPSTQPDDAPLAAGEREKLLNILITSQHITLREFNIAMETTAYLRRMVTPTATAQLTEENIRERFNALYGEKAHVRWIRVNSMLEISKLESDLKAGSSFEDLARLHAIDGSGQRASGDEAPFSRQDLHYPPEFRMVAFSLKPGQISDPVNVADSLYLIQLVEMIPPQHAKYEDYRDYVRQDLLDQTVNDLMTAERQKIGQIALTNLDIQNPVLRQQWQANLAEKTNELRSAQQLRDQLQKQQQELTTLPASPTTQP